MPGVNVMNLLLFFKELCITGSQSCMVNHSDIFAVKLKHKWGISEHYAKNAVRFGFVPPLERHCLREPIIRNRLYFM